jgi:hypothetical protein
MAAVVCEGGEEVCVHACARVFRVYAYICACEREIVCSNGMAAVIQRERERERDRQSAACPSRLRPALATEQRQKNAELLPRGDGYLQTGQYV